MIAPDRHGDPMSIDKSFGEREDGRQLLTANELRDLKEGEWVVDRTKMRRDLRGQRLHPIQFCKCKRWNRNEISL